MVIAACATAPPPFPVASASSLDTVREASVAPLALYQDLAQEPTADWNVISRTIVPLVAQDDIFTGAGSQSGLGDIVQSAFLSPKSPTAGGWIWGAGPVLLLPTGTDDLLTADKWGTGPTAVALKKEGPWTYGGLANHIWSFAGDDSRAEVNATFLQPFLSYTTPTAWTCTLNTESTYDWVGEEWSVPVNALVSKVMKIGSQLVSIGGGVRYWADGPDSGAEGLGFRLTFTLLFRSELANQVS